MNDFFINAVRAEDAGNCRRLQSLNGIDVDTAVVGNAFGNDQAVVFHIDDIPFVKHAGHTLNTYGQEARAMS